MIDHTVARRYAEAFVNVLEKGHRVDNGLEELKDLSETYTRTKELRNFLGSPEIAEEDKQKLLSKVFGGTVGGELMGLMEILLKKERVDHLPVIAQEAKQVAEDRQGLVRGAVSTARPISSAETDRIAQSVGKLLKKQVILERHLDPGLLGGIRVSVGTILLDGSVQARLKEIGQELKGVNVALR